MQHTKYLGIVVSDKKLFLVLFSAKIFIKETKSATMNIFQKNFFSF